MASMDPNKTKVTPLFAAIIDEIVENDDFLKRCESFDHCNMLDDTQIEDLLHDEVGAFVSNNLERFSEYVNKRLIENLIEDLERFVDERKIRDTF